MVTVVLYVLLNSIVDNLNVYYLLYFLPNCSTADASCGVQQRIHKTLDNKATNK